MRVHAGGHGTREGVGMSGDLFATTFISPCNDHPPAVNSTRTDEERATTLPTLLL